MTEITFFDIPCAQGKSWSPNTEKTRLSLNFKGLKYKTVYIEYPNIGPTLSALGLPANYDSETGVPWTLPALQIGSAPPFTETLVHLKFLDNTYPDLPTLVPPEAKEISAKFDALLEEIDWHWYCLLVCGIGKGLLGPISAEYFVETREKKLGLLEDVAGPDGSEKQEEIWAKLEAGLKPIVELLKERRGPFFMGKKATFIDLKMVGYLHWALRAKKSVFDRIIGFDESLNTLWNATRVWREGSGQ